MLLDYTYLIHTQNECEITHSTLMLTDYKHAIQVLEWVRGEGENYYIYVLLCSVGNGCVWLSLV